MTKQAFGNVRNSASSIAANAAHANRQTAFGVSRMIFLNNPQPKLFQPMPNEVFERTPKRLRLRYMIKRVLNQAKQRTDMKAALTALLSNTGTTEQGLETLPDASAQAANAQPEAAAS